MMERQNEELDTLMQLADEHEKKSYNIREMRLDDAENDQMFLNVNHDRLRDGQLDIIKDEIIMQKVRDTKQYNNISEIKEFKPSFKRT